MNDIDIDFCYWDCKSKIDLIITIIWQTFTTGIGLITFLRILALVKLYRHHNKRISTLLLVHMLILFWSITLSVAKLYSIGVFIFELEGELTDADMIDYSHFYAVIEAFPGFLVQTLFITICYKFCSNILKQEDISLFSKYCTPFKKVLMGYIIIRITLRIVIIFLIAFSSKQNIGLYSYMQFISLIVDSGLINLFLIGVAKLFIWRLDTSHLASLKFEFGSMFLCSFSRICIDLFYVQFGPPSEENHLCAGYFDITYTLLQNVFGFFLLYILPISIILKIYQYDHYQARQPLLTSQRTISRQKSESSRGKSNNNLK